MRNTGYPPISCTWTVPRTLVIPDRLPVRSFVAKFPSVPMTRGWISSSCLYVYGWQDSISSGCGSRLPGGRQRSTFVIQTSSRVRPIPSSSSARSPWRSSSAPGASPTNIRSASALPDPKTTLVRVSESGQSSHTDASRYTFTSRSRRSSRVALTKAPSPGRLRAAP